MKINFEEIRKQNWDEGENRLYEIIKNYEQNDLAALAVNYFHDLCTKRIENELLRKQLENAVVLPCKVGDTVYFNTYKNNATECIGVQPHKVESICVGYYIGNNTAIYDYDFGSSVFLTKPEAEAKLKELQGDK